MSKPTHKAKLPAAAVCQVCGYEADASTCVSGNHRPQPAHGDLSVCLNCGAFGVFTAELALRALRVEETGSLPQAAITYQFAIRYRGLLAEAAAAKILKGGAE